MSDAIFVTGTDTGIGKTLVSCAIAAALERRGLAVAVYKPIETGCRREGERLVGADGLLLLAAAGHAQSADSVSSYLFELPAAPLAAAEAACTQIEPARLCNGFERLSDEFDFVLVEGAGGLLVPIAHDYTFSHLADDLDLAVLCVVGSRLGCINHALLTLETLDALGLETLGYVINELEAGRSSDADEEDAGVPDAPDAASHRRLIAAFTQERDLGLFPFVPLDRRNDFETLADLAEQHLDLDALL